MEILLALFKQLPPVLPRVLLLLALGALLLLPRGRALLTRGGKRRLRRTRDLLEVRKLQIEVEVLRAQHPEVADTPLDARLARLLRAEEAGAPEQPEEDEDPPLPWPARARGAFAGSLAIFLVAVLAALAGGRHEGMGLVHVALRDLLVLVPCGLLASALPSRAAWASALYGAVLPALVAALVIAARLRD